MKLKEKAKRFFTMNAANHEGFTLVELIVVIAILAILAGVAVPAYSGYIKKAEKAGDMQLLGAVNEAFAAACMVDNVAAKDVASATLEWDGNKIVGVATVNGADYDIVNDNFKMFYGDNKNSEFKVLTGKLVFAGGVFREMNGAFANVFNAIIGDTTKYGDSIAAVQNSAFATAIGSEALLSQVTDVASMATDLIKGSSTLTDIVMDPDYITEVATMLGRDPAEYYQEIMGMVDTNPDQAASILANSTVLNVAATMNSESFDEDTLLTNLAGLEFGEITSTLNGDDPQAGLSNVAALYGMYTAFDPEGAKDLVETQDVSKLRDLGDAFITNEDGTKTTFADYIADINTEGSQAYNDYLGYKEALNLVNSAANESPEAANQILTNGYSDGDLQAMLQQIMGS